MKKYRIITFLVAVFSLVAFSANAQYDDIYYNPDENRASDFQSTDRQAYSYDDDATSNTTRSTDQYDDEAYDYYYTSRIRRFHRPTYGFGYFDPVYTDLYYYDPFLTPGRTVLIYDTPYSYASWNRFNRFRNRPYGAFGFGGPSFYGSSFAFRNTFGAGFGAPFGGFYPGSFYGPAYGFGGFNNGFAGYGYGGGSALYCPPTYGAGYSYNTVNSVADNNTTYGPRSRTSSTTAPRTNAPRTDRTNEGTVTSRSGRSIRSTDNATPTRVSPNTGRDRRLTPTTIDRSRISQDRTRSTRAVERTTRQSARSRTFTTPRTTTPRSTINRQAPARRNYTPATRTRTIQPRSSGSSIRSTPSRSSTPRSSGSRTSGRRGGGE